MLRPTAVSVKAVPDYRLMIVFDNGERKLFDVRPYIQGEWYGELKDADYFKTVNVDGFTVVWKNGQDICPDDLYYLSVPADWDPDYTKLTPLEKEELIEAEKSGYIDADEIDWDNLAKYE